MATKVNFVYGTTNPTWSTKFTNGMIYFNTSLNNIYLKQNGSITVFNGNNDSGLVGISNAGGVLSKINEASTFIQNAPMKIGSSYTSSISGATSWYSLFGQGKASSVDMVNSSWNTDSDIDTTYSDVAGTSCPILSSAKEIVIAVDLSYLAQAANGGNYVSGSGNFGYTPSDVIVHCYRTTESDTSACETTNSGGSPGGAMFVGKILLGLGNNAYSSDGAEADLCSLKISLCMNASNAVSIVGRIFKIASGSEKNTSKTFYGTSAQYAYDMGKETYYSNIEKHLYPLYIRYI